MALIVATANLGCAFAARGIASAGIRAGGAALSSEMALAGTLRGGAMLGAARGMGTAAGLGIELSELTAFRGATGGLFSARSLVRMGRANVVVRNGGVLGLAESTGAESLWVRSSRSGVTVHATRTGSRVAYRAGDQSVGFSELRNGRLHHYVRDAGGDHYIGYDVIQARRVLQYDANGLFIAETSLQGAGISGSGSAAVVAAFLAGSTKDQAKKSKEEAIGKQARVLLDDIDKFLASRR